MLPSEEPERVVEDRALATLLGLAIGDAMGMPSQTLTRPMIQRHYGHIDTFVAPFAGHPVSHGLVAAAVTDDTEQALLLARRLVDSAAGFDAEAWAQDLLGWEASVESRGLLDLLGPSTRRSLDALLAGTPASEAGRNGTTNGAAMRIAPVGIATPVEPLSAFADQIEAICEVTHHTAEAMGGAAAVAALISAGVDGADFEQALPVSLAAAREAGQRGSRQGEVDMVERIQRALTLAGHGNVDSLVLHIGTSVATRESVAMAFAVARLAEYDPWQVAVMSANLGDDTDTIGAIATAMVASVTGLDALPDAAVNRIIATNSLDLPPLVSELLQRRTRLADDEAEPQAPGCAD